MCLSDYDKLNPSDEENDVKNKENEMKKGEKMEKMLVNKLLIYTMVRVISRVLETALEDGELELIR